MKLSSPVVQLMAASAGGFAMLTSSTTANQDAAVAVMESRQTASAPLVATSSTRAAKAEPKPGTKPKLKQKPTPTPTPHPPNGCSSLRAYGIECGRG